MADTQNKLPISIDVSVSLSKAQVATGTDMTIIAFCTPNVDFLHGDRVRLYSTADSFNKICNTGDSVWWAGNAFFSKSKRPNQIAVGKIFEESQPAYLLGSTPNLASLSGLTNGCFAITIDGDATNVTGLNFSNANTIDAIAEVVNTAIESKGICEVYKGSLIIKSLQTGDSATISYASTVADITEEQVDVSSLLGLTANNGAIAQDGYTAKDIAGELQAIADSGVQLGTFFYGWALDSTYRDTEDQELAATWVNGRSYRACGAFCTNNVSAYNPSDTTNNAYKALNNGYSAVTYVYDDNSQVYPDISYLANFLAVNYSLANSTIAGKFKDADGIASVNFPDIETNVQALNARRINTITGIIGQTIKYFREGVQSSSAWSTDGWVNICNFIAELEISILNVFLRNNKIAYTTNGQNLILAAASKICNKYKQNGSFADRLEEDSTSDTGTKLVPAYQLDIQELSATTAAQRASHIGTPLQITVNDAGWMGSIAINVDVLA